MQNFSIQFNSVMADFVVYIILHVGGLEALSKGNWCASVLKMVCSRRILSRKCSLPLVIFIL